MIPNEPKLRQLLTVFLEENKKLNLSAHRTEEECWILNILDSLAFLDLHYHLQPITYNLLDLGTGGGFPLLPLATTLPEHHFIGIDATRKKVEAVQRIVDALGLTNVHAYWGRAEALRKDPLHHEQYDIILARALEKLPELLPLCVPFAKPGGSIVLWKSMHIAEELQKSLAVQERLRCRLVHAHGYTLPGNFGERQLLVFQRE